MNEELGVINAMIDSSYIETQVMFELEKSKELTIDETVLYFLQNSQYPWELLGDKIEKMIYACKENKGIKTQDYVKIYPNVTFQKMDSIFIEEGAVIEPYSLLCGPLFISKGATVRHGAYLRGNCFLSDGSIVGHTTECKNALFLNQAKAAHFNYIGDSILGYDVNLGAGTKLANLKFDHSQIKIRTRHETILTGIKKFGAILGNRAQTGCNSVTNPGTIFLPDTFLLPNKTALGIIFK